MTGFEVFSRSLIQLRREPTLTIQKNGVLSLNKTSELALNCARAVELLYDPEQRMVGLRAADPSSPDAYALRAVAGPNVAPFIISASAFLRHYAIEHSVSRRWPAYLREGILCADLSGDSVVVTSNRARRGPAAS